MRRATQRRWVIAMQRDSIWYDTSDAAKCDRLFSDTGGIQPASRRCYPGTSARVTWLVHYFSPLGFRFPYSIRTKISNYFHTFFPSRGIFKNLEFYEKYLQRFLYPHISFIIWTVPRSGSKSPYPGGPGTVIPVNNARDPGMSSPSDNGALAGVIIAWLLLTIDGGSGRSGNLTPFVWRHLGFRGQWKLWCFLAYLPVSRC